jgi:hypothetical protein
MSQTESYQNVLSTIEALAGNTLETSEKARMVHLVNRRARKIYRATQYWPTYLIINDRRPVHGDNEVYSEETVNDALIDTYLRIFQGEAFIKDGAREYEFFGGPNGAVLVGYEHTYDKTWTPTAATNTAGTVVVTLDSTHDFIVGDSVQLSGWATYSGVPDINGTHTITAVTSTTITFSQTYTGTQAWTIAGDEEVNQSTVYVTGKTRLDVKFGTEQWAVPVEWVQYCAHGAYADFLRGEGQVEKAAVEEGFAKECMLDELERIDAMHYANSIGKRIQTHATRQSRSIAIR